MTNTGAIKAQITRILKKSGYRPSKPSKGRIKPSHGMRLMDSGFMYRADGSNRDAFCISYYPGAFSTKMSEAQVSMMIEGMFRCLGESSIKASFELSHGEIRVLIHENKNR